MKVVDLTKKMEGVVAEHGEGVEVWTPVEGLFYETTYAHAYFELGTRVSGFKHSEWDEMFFDDQDLASDYVTDDIELDFDDPQRTPSDFTFTPVVIMKADTE